MTRVAIIIGICALCIGRAALAQTPVDTLQTPPASTNASANYSGGIRGDVSTVSLGNRLTASVRFPSGIMSQATLSTDEANYRIEDRRTMNKSFVSSILYPALPGLTIDGAISEMNTFNRLITSQAGATQDLSNDLKEARAGALFSRPLSGGFSMNSHTSLAISSSKQTFEDDQTTEGSLRAGLRYVRGSAFDATVSGFFGRSALTAESGDDTYSGLGTGQDSVLARVKMVVRDSAMVRAEYSRYTKRRDYLELPRTSQGSQQFGGKPYPERESQDVKNIFVDGETKPLRGVRLNVSASHSDAATYFALAQERIRRDTGDVLSGKLMYSRGGGTMVTVDLENKRVFHWLGPRTSGSYDDRDKRVGFGWNQTLTKTLQYTLQAGASLKQSFYVDTPSDQDQRYQFANVRLNSKPFPKISASVYVSVSKLEQLKIRASSSQNNRAETVYELRPEVVYKINQSTELTQKYGLNIQYADYVFQGNNNYLDRTISFSNLVRTRLTKSLGVDFYYALQLHDRGAYLRKAPGADRVLEVYQEERRDEVKLSFRYQINKHLGLTGMNEYTQRKDLMDSSNQSAVFKNGGVEVGIDGNYDFGAKRTLKFAMKRVKRFGRFNAEAQEDYWVMDSSINYAF